MEIILWQGPVDYPNEVCKVHHFNPGHLRRSLQEREIIEDGKCVGHEMHLVHDVPYDLRYYSKVYQSIATWNQKRPFIDAGALVYAIDKLYRFFENDRLFKDFRDFIGTYDCCRLWVLESRSLAIAARPYDFNRMSKTGVDWIPGENAGFTRLVKTPGEIWRFTFAITELIDTESLFSFKNPFRQLLHGTVETDTFLNATKCLRDRTFNAIVRHALGFDEIREKVKNGGLDENGADRLLAEKIESVYEAAARAAAGLPVAPSPAPKDKGAYLPDDRPVARGRPRKSATKPDPLHTFRHDDLPKEWEVKKAAQIWPLCNRHDQTGHIFRKQLKTGRWDGVIRPITGEDGRTLRGELAVSRQWYYRKTGL